MPTTLSPPPHVVARMDSLSARLAANWWAVVLRGLFGIVFGALTFLAPGVTLATLVLFAAAYLFVDGVFALVGAVRAAQHHERWGALTLEGLVDILAAIAFVANPGLTIVFFIYLIAAWAIVSGCLMIAGAFRLHGTHGRWLLGIAGLFSAAFGILLLAAPIAGAVVLAYWLGGYALAFGIMLVALGLRLRTHRPAVTGIGSVRHGGNGP